MHIGRILRDLVLFVTVGALIAVFSIFLLLEEEEEEGGILGSFKRPAKSRPRGLSEAQQDYLDELYESISAHSLTGARRMRRYYALSVLALIAAGSVPVAVAGHISGWVVASLGAVAAIAQGIVQLAQDQRMAAEHHAMAVQLSRSIRRFAHSKLNSDGRVTAAEFESFVRDVESARESQDDILVNTLRRPD